MNFLCRTGKSVNLNTLWQNHNIFLWFNNFRLNTNIRKDWGLDFSDFTNFLKLAEFAIVFFSRNVAFWQIFWVCQLQVTSYHGLKRCSYRMIFTGSWIRHELGLKMKHRFDSLEILMVFCYKLFTTWPISKKSSNQGID